MRTCSRPMTPPCSPRTTPNTRGSRRLGIPAALDPASPGRRGLDRRHPSARLILIEVSRDAECSAVWSSYTGPGLAGGREGLRDEDDGIDERWDEPFYLVVFQLTDVDLAAARHRKAK